MCILFEEPPKKTGTGKGATYDYWEPAKKKVFNAQLINRCTNYPRDDIKPEVIKALAELLNSDDWDEGGIQKASLAAYGLAKYVKAMVQYDEAIKIVKPKKIQLAEAEAESAKAQAVLDAAMENLRQV